LTELFKLSLSHVTCSLKALYCKQSHLSNLFYKRVSASFLIIRKTWKSGDYCY